MKFYLCFAFLYIDFSRLFDFRKFKNVSPLLFLNAIKKKLLSKIEKIFIFKY